MLLDVQVGASAGLFYGYVGVIGILLWGMFKWMFKAPVGLTQIWCAYGACPYLLLFLKGLWQA